MEHKYCRQCQREKGLEEKMDWELRPEWNFSRYIAYCDSCGFIFVDKDGNKVE